MNRAAAMTFFRNTIARSPEFGDQWEVVNIETLDGKLLFDTNNGYTISCDIRVYLTVEEDI